MPGSGPRAAMGGWRPVATRQCGSRAGPSTARDSGALQVWGELWLSHQQRRVGWRGSEGLWGCGWHLPAERCPQCWFASLTCSTAMYGWILYIYIHIEAYICYIQPTGWRVRFISVLAEGGCNTCACDFHLSFHNSFSVSICVSLSTSAVTHYRACYAGLCQG